VVNCVRRRFRVPKVGHCGTLDPAATGLLVIVLGRATKLSEKLSGHDKLYSGTMMLGIETDSQDREGEVTVKMFDAAPAPGVKSVKDQLDVRA
jgi:tRNA pseudouridine55 synthase